jgi:hypothetical protein
LWFLPCNQAPTRKDGLCRPERRLGLVEAIGHAAVWAGHRPRTFSFDHLVGAQQDRWGYRKAERLGGLEVHGHLEFCRKLHREIARLLAA